VEWVKSRARVAKAREEVMLLKEEMQRVLAFPEWKAGWWLAQLEPSGGVTKELAEDICTFAEMQAGLQQDLLKNFHEKWNTPLDDSTTGGNEVIDAEQGGEDSELGNNKEVEDDNIEDIDEFAIDLLSDDEDAL
jgi:hypothetical protein